MQRHTFSGHEHTGNCIHAQLCAKAWTYVHRHICILIHMHTVRHTQVLAHTEKSWAHRYTLTHAHMGTQMFAHMCMYVHTRACACGDTHAHACPRCVHWSLSAFADTPASAMHLLQGFLLVFCLSLEVQMWATQPGLTKATIPGPGQRA